METLSNKQGKSLITALRMTAFAILVAVMIGLAATVGRSADSVLARADGLHDVNIHLCYSECTFSRSIK